MAGRQPGPSHYPAGPRAACLSAFITLHVPRLCLHLSELCRPLLYVLCPQPQLCWPPGHAGGIDEFEEPDEETAEKLLMSGSGLLLGGGVPGRRGGLLPPGLLELSRLRDANGASPSDAVVQALQFHPNGQLMLTAGLDKRLKLFQVSCSSFCAVCAVAAAEHPPGGCAEDCPARRCPEAACL